MSSGRKFPANQKALVMASLLVVGDVRPPKNGMGAR